MDVVLYYISLNLCVIELVFLYRIVTKKEKVNIRIEDIIYLLFTNIITLALNSYNYLLIVKSIYAFTNLIIINKVIYKDKMSITIINTFIIWLIGLVLDLLTSGIIYLFLKNSIKKYMLIYQTVGTVIIIIIMYYIYRKKNLRNKHTKVTRTLKKINVYNIYYLLITIILLTFDLWCYKNMNNSKLYSSMIMLVILLINIIILISIIIKNKKEYRDTYQYLLTNNIKIKDVLNDYRIYKHNINNELLVIKSVAPENIKIMIEDVFKEYKINNNMINKVPTGIDGIIIEKVHPYLEMGLNIRFDNEIKEDTIYSLSPKIYRNLCKNMCIILDNALESCNESKEKIMTIGFRESEKEIIIEIANTFNEKIDIDKLGNINYTTKEKGHGLGLFSLFNNKSIKTKSNIYNNVFHNNLYIKKT